MSKLNEIKQKILALLEQIRAKILALGERFPVLKKILPKFFAAKPQGPKEDSVSLKLVYKEGSTSTRLVVVFVFIFLASFVYFGSVLSIGLYHKYSKAKVFHESKDEFAEKLAKERDRVRKDAAVISIGHISTDAVTPSGQSAFLNVDIYAICDGPETGRFLEDNGLRAHSKIIEIYRHMLNEKMSPISEAGREYARTEIIKALNQELEHGKVLQIDFFNLVVE